MGLLGQSSCWETHCAPPIPYEKLAAGSDESALTLLRTTDTEFAGLINKVLRIVLGWDTSNLDGSPIVKGS